MVTEVFIEGDKKLRPGFSQLLRQKVKRQFIISMEGSVNDTVKKLLKPDSASKALLMDLDAAEMHKGQKLKELKLERDKTRVYFMVQKMEAWFLSQPAVIISQFGIDVSKKIGRAPHEIEKPDEELSRLVNAKGREYHKVRDVAAMLIRLNLELSEPKFPDVKNLVAELSKA